MESKHFLTTDSTSLGLSCTLIQSNNVTLKQSGLANSGVSSSKSAARSPPLSVISLVFWSLAGSAVAVPEAEKDVDTLEGLCASVVQRTESVDFSSSVYISIFWRVVSLESLTLQGQEEEDN